LPRHGCLAVSRIFRRGVSAHQCVTAHTCIRSRHGVSTTMATRQEERWLLPRHQTDYPARDVVSEGKLHARREATFLVLSMLFGVTLTVLLVLGTTRVIDLGAVIARVV